MVTLLVWASPYLYLDPNEEYQGMEGGSKESLRLFLAQIFFWFHKKDNGWN